MYMPCENYDNIHCADLSFPNYSMSDSKYSEIYPGFYNFVMDLLIWGLTNSSSQSFILCFPDSHINVVVILYGLYNIDCCKSRELNLPIQIYV